MKSILQKALKKIILGTSDESFVLTFERSSQPAYHIDDWQISTLGPCLLQISVVRFSLVRIFKKSSTMFGSCNFPYRNSFTSTDFHIKLWLLMISLVDFIQVDICQTQKFSKPRTRRIIYLKVWWYRMNVFFFQNCIFISRVQSLMPSLNI